jgi:hypothetical protein
MLNDSPLPGFESIVDARERVNAELLESRKRAVIDACLHVIDVENKGGITAGSWCLLQLETAIKNLRQHANR